MNFGAVLLDTSQWVGMGGFGLAALLCARVARYGARGWWILTAANVFLVIEIAAGWRYRVHDFADALLLKQNLYEARGPWQVAMIGIALVMLVAAGLTARARIRSASLASAVSGVCFAMSIFVVESISLHAVDAVFYRPAGPVSVIAMVWLAASAWIGLAAVRAAREATTA